MAQPSVEGRRENGEDPAMALLRQAEHYAIVGLFAKAQALLAQVWSAARVRDAGLASTAAWEVAWLLVRSGAYREAAAWFDRVITPPASGSRFWPVTQQAVAELCRALTDGPPVAPAPPDPPSTPRSASLQVRNLGHFQIIRAGEVLPLCKTRKAIAIFRYLLTRRERAAHKEELMELFWPDASPREAVHSLHVAVSMLRRHLDPDPAGYVRFEAGYYRIDPDAPVEDDCAVFQRHSDEGERWWAAGDLRRARQAYLDAVACYGGDYSVDELDLTWAVAERERLLARYLTALDRVGRILMGQGQFELATGYYQRLVDRDSYREDAYGQLMRCYWQLGRRGEALRQYERCADILAKDLGLEPMQEIQALYGTITRAEPAGERGHPAIVHRDDRQRDTAHPTLERWQGRADSFTTHEPGAT